MQIYVHTPSFTIPISWYFARAAEGSYRKRPAIRKVRKAAVQARRTVYMAVIIAHFHPPLSFFMATNVAMHGKYSRMNTI